MITKLDVTRIITQLERGEKLFPTLKKLSVSPMEFFTHLNDNPDEKIRFELARQITIEHSLDENLTEIDLIASELDLKKTTLKLKTNQWLAEKLIPQVYGPQMNINVNKTIDIRTTLQDARSRVWKVEKETNDNIIELEAISIRPLDKNVNIIELSGKQDEYKDILGNE